MILIRLTAFFLLLLLNPVLAQNDGSSAPPGGIDGAGPASMITEALMASGESIFTQNCVTCHQLSGEGAPPAFPALAKNENLSDLELIVTRIHRGRGAMPAFSRFNPEELASIATYIRNAWGNEFGGITEQDIQAILDTLAELDDDESSVSEAWYTLEQAERGQGLYVQHCSECHGVNFVPDDFAPSLVSASFDWYWGDRTAFDFYEAIRTTMPFGRAGTLSRQAYIDIVAYLFEVNEFPAGEAELQPDPDLLQQMPIRR